MKILLAAGDVDAAAAGAELGRRPGSALRCCTRWRTRRRVSAWWPGATTGRAGPCGGPGRRGRDGAPYESAKARVLTAEVHRLLGEQHGAEMELEAAEWVFDQFGAVPDLQPVGVVVVRTTADPRRAREVEVLKLVATGMTNRAIAAELFLSEKTISRHLSNIFAKLGLASRAAATAYAFQQGLVAASDPSRQGGSGARLR